MAQEKRWESDDGWDEKYFEPLLNAQSRLDTLGYELKNCVRQTAPEDIASQLEDIEQTIKEFKEQMLEDLEEDNE